MNWAKPALATTALGRGQRSNAELTAKRRPCAVDKSAIISALVFLSIPITLLPIEDRVCDKALPNLPQSL